jgi:hypothetical protein
MAIDIRASTTCSLGPLINASINDDYIQGSGLVRISGSCEIAGLVTPAIGAVVTFSYTKNGTVYNIPRKLRVLSSFADPFRNTTSVSLGCKLTYLQDLTDPIDWTAFDDPENDDRTEDEEEIVVIPIYASSIMNKCLQELGITASQDPLTNKFSISEFDFSNGYVNILSDLLVSESFCGFLDFNETLQVFSLDQTGGTGPVLNQTSIIDIGPINVGELPGEAVVVSYTTLKLKQREDGSPDSDSSGEADWDFNQTTSTGEMAVSYGTQQGGQRVKRYSTYEQTTTITSYRTLNTRQGERKRVVDSRRTLVTQSGISVLSSPASAYLSQGFSFNPQSVSKVTQEQYSYDSNGNEKVRTKRTSGSAEHIAGSAPVPWEINGDLVSPYYSGAVALDLEVTYSNTIESPNLVGGRLSSTMTYTQYYQHGSSTVAAQQSLAQSRNTFNSASSAQSFLGDWVKMGLSLTKTTSNLSESGVNQTAPSLQAINNSRNADASGDPSNGYRTESKSELELVLGSATAQRRIEFSMPYAPDDIFSKNNTTPVTYSATPSDAPQKAQKYGICQNRLLLGGRNGMNLQLSPEILPSAPFAPIIVQAAGYSVLYRANGTAWTLDANGVIVSTDALFWGAIGTSSITGGT